MSESNYAEMVAKAELAVKAVKDPELRRIAFQKILEDLLSVPAASVAAMPQVKVHRRPRGSAAVAGEKRVVRGTRAYIEELVGEDFFKKPKTIAQVKAELENRGHHIPLTSLSGPLQKLCQRRQLRRQKAAGTADQKKTYAYSNW